MNPILVLLVDDEPDQLLLAETYLPTIDLSLNVETASSAGEAFKLLKVRSFDCIVTDYKMPEINGLEFCRKLRGEGVSAPIILYTGQGSEEVAEEAFAAGFDDYLKKEKSLATYSVLARNIKSHVAKGRVDEELKLANQRLNNVLDSIRETFWQLDREYRFVYVSRAFADAAGMNQGQMIGRCIWELFPKHIGTAFERNVREAMDLGEIRRFETPGRYTGAWYSMTIYPSVDGVSGFGADITERVKTEAALRENVSILNSFFDSPGIMRGIVEVVDDSTIRHVADNEATASFLGVKPEAMKNRLTTALDLSPEIIRIWKSSYEKSRETGKPVRFEYLDNRGGREAWLSASVNYLGENPNGTQRYAYVVFDETGHRRSERERAESEERFRSIINNSLDVIYRFNIQTGRYEFMSPSSKALLNFEPEELMAMSNEEVMSRVHPDDLPALRSVLANLNKLGKGVGVYRFRGNDGFYRWWSNNMVISRDAEGKPLYRDGFVRDITEQIAAEEELRASNARLDLLQSTARQLLESSEPQRIVNDLCTRVMNFLGCDVFVNYLLDTSMGRLHLNASHGIPNPTVKSIEWLDLGIAVCGCVARDGERIVCENVQETTDPRTDLVRSFGVRAYACHPLLSEGRLIGTLSFGSKTRDSFSTDDLKVMASVANQVSVAMGQMRGVEALRHSEERYRTLFESMSQGVTFYDADLRRVSVNPAAERILGVSVKILKDRTGTSASVKTIAEDGHELIPDEFPIVIAAKTGKPVHDAVVGIYNASDGSLHWVKNDITPLYRDGDPKPYQYYAIFEDITEQKRAEDVLKRSEELYTSMIEGVALHEIVENDSGDPVNYRITDINSAYERITGLKKTEIVGKLATEAYGTDAAPYLDTYVRVAETGVPVSFETYFPPMDKHFRVSVFSSSRSKFTTVFDDITERKKSEMGMKRLTNVLNALNDINKILSKAPDETTYMNEVCQAIVKDTNHSMVWVGFAEDDEAKRVRPVAYAGFDEGYIRQMNITWADTDRGRGPTGSAIRTGSVAVCRNMLTDPKFAPWRGEAIKRGYKASIVFPLVNAEKTFGAISIYSGDPDPWSKEEIDLLQQVADDFSLGILSIREREAKLKAEEELRQSKERVQEYANKLEQMVVERTAKLIESEETLRGFMNSSDEAYAIYDSELRLIDMNQTGLRRLPEGTRKDDLIGKRITEVYPGIENTNWYPAYLEVLRMGRTYHGEGRAVSMLGERLLYASAFKVGDGLGVVSRDITEQRRTEERLRSAEKVETMNRLGATVAHDLRGPLNIVMLSLEMAAKEPETAPKMLEMARTNAGRALQMIETFRAGTKEVKVTKMVVDLPALVRETVEGVPRPDVVSIDINQEKAPQKVMLDPEVTRRVVDNLVRNAVEAMPEGGKLTVTTKREGTEAVIEVSDTGVGISKEASETLFEPLFTTKKGGLGLGLYFVKMAVEAQGGMVGFTSEPREGTTFRVCFPLE